MYENSNLIYERKLRIRSEQVTAGRIMRTSELFKLMEEASIAHTEELGCTREKTLDRGFLWVIARQTAELCTKPVAEVCEGQAADVRSKACRKPEAADDESTEAADDESTEAAFCRESSISNTAAAEYEPMPAYDEEITIRSWPGKMIMGMFFPRFYEVWRDDRLIIRGYAMWALIDENTRGVIFPDEYDIFVPGLPGAEEIFLPALVKPADAADIADTTEEGAGISERVRFSQVDINGHMNNTRYFDIIDDALWNITSRNCQDKKPSDKNTMTGIPHWTKISANYMSELRAGDRYDLNVSISEKNEPTQKTTYYFEGIRTARNEENEYSAESKGSCRAKTDCEPENAGRSSEVNSFRIIMEI